MISVVVLVLFVLVTLWTVTRGILKRFALISDISGKYVVITGCDTGFGNMLAKHLDQFGVNVFASCLTKDGMTTLDAVTSHRTTVFQMDISKHQNILDAYALVKSLLPPGKGNTCM